MLNEVDRAVKILQSGGIVGIPTETVYGLAASLAHPEAICRIFQVKGRPTDHPLIVHIADKQDLNRLACPIPPYVMCLMEHFWPGPLTLLLKKTEMVSSIITGGQDTVAIRMPAHPLALEIIQRVGPIVAPSANRFGKISPTTAEHVRQDLGDSVDFVVDGGRCSVGIESTILDATDPEYALIARAGILKASDFNTFLGYECVHSNQKSNMVAPGNLNSHYCPNKPLKLFSDLKMLEQLQKKYANSVHVLSFDNMPHNPTDYAYQLYFQLRLADLSDAAIIAVELPSDLTGWEAVLDRLKKAST